MVRAEEIIAELNEMRDETQAANLLRFFKTGPGDYGEGDRFLGLKCPQTRGIVKLARLQVPLAEIEKLLRSEWHEVRFAGFMLLVEEMRHALPLKVKRQTPAAYRRGSAAESISLKNVERSKKREEIACFYLKHARKANNWDLVDMTCPKILGEWLLHPRPDGRPVDRGILDKLVASDNLWEQRIGIVTTWRLIREGKVDDTLRLAPKLLDHPHDLIHKATGWMLREVGKHDMTALTAFLETHFREMPRTALRYAIEKLPEADRRYWLARR